MGLFRRFANAVARFMYGRNGMDQLNLLLVVCVLVLYLVSGLLAGRQDLLAIILYWIALLLWLLVIFRMFSKNLYKRRAENAKFAGWMWKLKSAQDGARARHADKDHKYFTCKNCKTICRVPVGKGYIIITCPKCGAQIKAKT